MGFLSWLCKDKSQGVSQAPAVRRVTPGEERAIKKREYEEEAKRLEQEAKEWVESQTELYKIVVTTKAGEKLESEVIKPHTYVETHWNYSYVFLHKITSKQKAQDIVQGYQHWNLIPIGDNFVKNDSIDTVKLVKV